MGTTLDLTKTVLSRAHLQPYNGVQGEDLLASLEGENGETDRPILIETNTAYPFLGFDDLVSVTTLIDGHWRLSIGQGCEWGELYDLENDPNELKNLWDEPEFKDVRSKLMHSMLQTIQNHGDKSPYPLSVA